MQIKNHWCFWLGVAAFIIMLVSYFIPINTETGANYVVVDSLLGIVIFHNAFILGLYLLGAVVLVVFGLQNNKHGYSDERRSKK